MAREKTGFPQKKGHTYLSRYGNFLLVNIILVFKVYLVFTSGPENLVRTSQHWCKEGSSYKPNAVPRDGIFLTSKEPRNRFQGIDSASICSLTGRYNNPIPTWFLAPIDCSKISVQGPKSRLEFLNNV
jgi:hypothetical protein